MQGIELLVRFKLFLFFSIFISLNSFLAGEKVTAFPGNNNSIDSLVNKGLFFLSNQEYSNAEKVFNELNLSYKTIPLGKLYLAAVEILKSNDYGTAVNKRKVESLLEEAETLAEALYKKNSNLLNTNYYQALVNGFFAYYKAIDKSYVAAFSYGFSAVEYFEKCLDFDKNFHDSFIALGTYKYWKSEKTDFLNWLPFVSDQKNEGIALLKRGVNSNSYSVLLGLNSLIWIYINEKNFSEAKVLAYQGLKKYPNSRLLMWGLARALDSENTNDANKIYDKLFESYSKDNALTNYRKIIILHKKAQNYVKNGEKQKAIELLKQIESIHNLTDYEKENLEKRLERVKKLLIELTQ